MSVNLRLTGETLEDLVSLCRVGPNALNGFAESLNSSEPAIVQPEVLAQLLASVTGDPSIDAKAATRFILGMVGVMTSRHVSANDILAGIDQALGRLSQEQLKDEVQAQWETLKSPFLTLLGCRRLAIVAKLTELAFEYSNLFQRAKIVTDIRPLYDLDGNEITTAIISCLLHINHFSRDGESMFVVALDVEDVTHLLHECERALKKTATAKALMKSLSVPAFCPGDESEENKEP